MDPFRDELGAAHAKIAELEEEKQTLENRHQNEKAALEVRLDQALHPAEPASQLAARQRAMRAAALGFATAMIVVLGALAFILLER